MREKNVIVIERPELEVKFITVTIEGTGDLCLNKMSEPEKRKLLAAQNGKSPETKINEWEEVITSIHWRDPLAMKDTRKECNEEMWHTLLKENAPCLSAFGLKKSFENALVRSGFEKTKTKFQNAFDIVNRNGLVPIRFAGYWIDERFMKPSWSGGPVWCRIPHFSGWSADIEISCTEKLYTRENIVNVINYAGFGQGIGNGTTSGYGRYKVVDVR